MWHIFWDHSVGLHVNTIIQIGNALDVKQESPTVFITVK